MNPVDQLLQNFGGTASNAIAGLFGTASTSDVANASPDMLFSGELAQANTVKPSGETVQGLLAAHFITGTEEATPGFGGLGPIPEVGGTVNLKAFLGLPNDAPISDIFNQLGQASIISGQPEGTSKPGDLASTLVPTSVNSIPKGAVVSMAPAAQLEQLGLRLEQLPALPSGEQIAAISASSRTPAGHVIQPDALSTALNNNPQAGIVPSNVAAEATLVTNNSVGAPGTEMTDVQTVKAVTTATSATPELLVVENEKTNHPAIQDSADALVPAQSRAATPANNPITIERTPETRLDVPAEFTASAPEQAPHAIPPAVKAAPDPTKQPDGHVTATAQQASSLQAPAAQAAQKKAVPSPAPKQATTGASHSQSVTDKGATLDIPKDTGSAKPVEHVMPRADTMPAPPQMPKETAKALTAERLSGFLDTTAASSVASGLAGMRNEGSFLSSMGLLGGRVSPEFAQQVGQQFNMQVSKAVLNGQKEFTVRLDPAELGRVQVKLSFGKDGSVQTRVLVERAETLDLLQKDTKALERAIASGGHKIEGGIQFGLDSNNEQSAGRAFAEAIQQEKMRDDLAARSGLNAGSEGFNGQENEEEIIPLDQVLANVSAETGVDISV